MKQLFFLLVISTTMLFTACEDVSVSRDSSANGGSEVSIGGSLASFAIQGNALYTINGEKLMTFDISQPSIRIPVAKANIYDKYNNPVTNLETIFPYGNHVFLGATNGMHIVDVSDPLAPKYVSNYEHVVSCDPVVVQGDIAYVTLRQANRCWQDVNELHVIDISDLEQPQLISTHQMDNPYGLGVDGDLLFICDDGNIEVFNCENPHNVYPIVTIERSEIFALDVIPHQGNLMVLGAGQMNQYAYSPGEEQLELLSSITNEE